MSVDSEIGKRESILEALKIDNEIEGERLEIARKKAEEAELKKKYGRDWRKYLGIGGRIAHSDLYSFNPELADMIKPGSRLAKLK